MKRVGLFLTLTLFASAVFAQKTGSFTDSRDGKTYKTVKIGKQIWMAENLAYKVDSGCVAYNNDQSNVDKYGYLYNWEKANKVCPAGWHLPNDAEWKKLIDYLGGKEVAGEKLKSKTGWDLYNGVNYGNNESGFSALPGGYLNSKGETFGNIGGNGHWWSSTSIGSKGARDLSLYDYYGGVIQLGNYRESKYSVRCLKDQLL